MGIFFDKKINNLKCVDNVKKGLKSKIVCFGDSITWGYTLGIQSPENYPASLKKRIKKEYPRSNISVINEGHNGWTSSDALSYVDKIIKLNPDLVIIMFGINDLLKGIDLKSYLFNIKQIIKKIKKFKIDVIFLSPTEINRNNNNILDVYARKALRIARYNGANIIDIRKIMKKTFKLMGVGKSYFLSIDTLHIKSSKYKIISELIYKKIF